MEFSRAGIQTLKSCVQPRKREYRSRFQECLWDDKSRDHSSFLASLKQRTSKDPKRTRYLRYQGLVPSLDLLVYLCRHILRHLDTTLESCARTRSDARCSNRGDCLSN